MNSDPLAACLDSNASPDEMIEHYIRLSIRFPGWTRGAEAEALARASLSMPDNAVIVEIGTFFGSGTVLLAGPRKYRGSGRVHCVDPFDGSGDSVSVPHYDHILTAFQGVPMRTHFEANMAIAELTDWVEVHQGLAHEVAAGWVAPIDMLVMDADHSPAGARLAYEAWAPKLVPGGLLALHNSHDREYQDGHQGHRLLVQEELVPSAYHDVYCVPSITFARKNLVA